MKIGDLNDNRFLDIREVVLVRLSPSSSVDTLPPFQHYSSSSFTSTPSSFTMSDIYTREPVMDFANPFLDFDQGYTRPFATILPTVRATLVPIAPAEEEESVLPKKPLTRKELKTRRGYPRGENQGESSGRILPSFLTRMLKDPFYRLVVPFQLVWKEEEGTFPHDGREGGARQTIVCLSLQPGWRVVQEGQRREALSFPSVGEGLDDDQ